MSNKRKSSTVSHCTDPKLPRVAAVSHVGSANHPISIDVLGHHNSDSQRSPSRVHLTLSRNTLQDQDYRVPPQDSNASLPDLEPESSGSHGENAIVPESQQNGEATPGSSTSPSNQNLGGGVSFLSSLEKYAKFHNGKIVWDFRDLISKSGDKYQIKTSVLQKRLGSDFNAVKLMESIIYSDPSSNITIKNIEVESKHDIQAVLNSFITNHTLWSVMKQA